MNALHFLLPWVIDDPLRPSGGNVYDARIRDGLRAVGWNCRVHLVRGTWPRPARGVVAELEQILQACGAGAPVLVDGVMAPAAAAALIAAARRLRIVILLHMPFGEASPELAGAEQAVLAECAAVITTSAWTRDWVHAHYGLSAARIQVASPGVDAAPLTAGSRAGNRLICVAHVSRLKGHDVLIEALAALADVDWSCTCVGAWADDRGFFDDLRRAARAAGIAARLRWTGPLTGAALEAAWAVGDALVLASRRESWGMVVGEALAHGVPVIATRAGGVAEALGRSRDHGLPGVLVEPASPAALAGALRAWLCDADLRSRLRAAAAQRRGHVGGWPATVGRIMTVLRGVQQRADDVA